MTNLEVLDHIATKAEHIFTCNPIIADTSSCSDSMSCKSKHPREGMLVFFNYTLWFFTQLCRVYSNGTLRPEISNDTKHREAC